MDITKLFGPMEQVRDKMEAVKKQMAQLEIKKETGAGLVKATVNGEKQLVSISIDPTLLNIKDQKMLQDLLIGAINLALEEVESRVQDLIQNSVLAV